MSIHSVADARDNLSGLIDRALAGEGVTITRNGRPVVELKPVQPPPLPVSADDIAWLADHRVKLRQPSEDAATLTCRMRDEDWR